MFLWRFALAEQKFHHPKPALPLQSPQKTKLGLFHRLPGLLNLGLSVFNLPLAGEDRNVLQCI